MNKSKIGLILIGVISLVLVTGFTFYHFSNTGSKSIKNEESKAEVKLDSPPFNLPLPNCEIRNMGENFEASMRSEMPEQMTAEAYKTSIGKEKVLNFYKETLAGWRHSAKWTHEVYDYKFDSMKFGKDNKLVMIVVLKMGGETVLAIGGENK